MPAYFHIPNYTAVWQRQ